MAETTLTHASSRPREADRGRNRSPRIIATLLISIAITLGLGVPALMNGFFGFNLTLGSGQSMEPTFQAGDLMITRSVPASSLAAGDVILFQRDGQRIIHRIVSLERSDSGGLTLTTRGDNNTVNDPPLPAEAVMGELVYSIAWPRALPFTLTHDALVRTQGIVAAGLLVLAMLCLRGSDRPGKVAAG